jgi:phosphoribosylanthranilate isomerase
MAKTLVKTCGITTPEDAVACFELGADFLGLVFTFSPRRVTVEQADAIREVLPEASLVGVFVDEPIDAAVEITRACRLNMIQLHGREDPNYCVALTHRTGLPVVRSMPAAAGNGAPLEAYRGLHGLLFDLAKDADATPEERERLWVRAADAAASGHRVFLAGRLDPGNVAEAVRRVRPFCVDVARGVERAPGVKDHELVRRFIEEVRRA